MRTEKLWVLVGRPRSPGGSPSDGDLVGPGRSILPSIRHCVGTRDPSPFLAAPEGIAFLRELGLDAVLAHNHDLAWRAGQFLADCWGTTLGFGETSVGAMVTVPAPASLGATSADAVRLRDALLFEDGIEVQVHAHASRVWVRVAAQVYNDWTDIEHLAQALAGRATPTS